MRVPFVDLRSQYENHRAEIDAAIAGVIAETAFIGGPYAKRFESEFSALLGVRNCVACANGTDAIYIPLRMLGIGAGDEVITTALTWISSAETITQAGATPVFVDIDEYFTLDVDQVAARITPRTRAVVAVHLYGHPARVDALAELCRSRGIHLIEDCAQAHLATLGGQVVGSFGVVGTFSFYPGKNLGAYGDAGALVTGDDALARRCRAYANHGAIVKHEHEMEGINSRLDGIQAAILSAKLPHLREWTAQRVRVARMYDELLVGVPGLSLPRVRPGATHVYHLYVVRSSKRDALRAFLAERGIETQVHYPRALPLLPAYARLAHRAEDFPMAASAQQEILSLPMFAEIAEEQVRHVAAAVREFHGG